MNSEYYEKLLEFPGAPEIRELAKRWNIFSENLGKIPPNLPVLLPDYLLLSPAGVGRTTLFHLMADYLEDTGLMLFQGDHRVIEFHLDYCKPNAPFGEFSRLLDVIQVASGFHSRFRGLVAIDCSAWLHHFDERHMQVLLEYLMDNTRDWLIFLIIDTDDKKEIDHIESIVSSYLRINVLHISYPTVEEMNDYVENQIHAYGFHCAPDTRELLTATMKRLRESHYFSGFETLDMLVEEILYSIYSEKASIAKTLTASQLVRFGPDGEFTRQMIENYARRSVQIGFNGGN